jgi:hypothetical protein
MLIPNVNAFVYRPVMPDTQSYRRFHDLFNDGLIPRKNIYCAGILCIY